MSKPVETKGFIAPFGQGDDARMALLAAAGLTPELLQRAVANAEAALDATTKGEPDHAAQARARQDIFNLAGVFASRFREPADTKVAVQIVLPDWMKPNTSR